MSIAHCDGAGKFPHEYGKEPVFGQAVNENNTGPREAIIPLEGKSPIDRGDSEDQTSWSGTEITQTQTSRMCVFVSQEMPEHYDTPSWSDWVVTEGEPAVLVSLSTAEPRRLSSSRKKV